MSDYIVLRSCTSNTVNQYPIVLLQTTPLCFWKVKYNHTVNDGVAHSKNPKKCAYHVISALDLDLEHTLDAR